LAVELLLITFAFDVNFLVKVSFDYYTFCYTLGVPTLILPPED